MRHAEQLVSLWGFRRALFESRSEARFVCLARSSCTVATSRQAAQGHPVDTGRDFWGGLPLVTFLGRARKVTSRRAAPGLCSSPAVRRVVCASPGRVPQPPSRVRQHRVTP